MRQCFRCKEFYTEDCFIKNSKKRGGFMAWCQACRDEVGLKGITSQECKQCKIVKNIDQFDRCQNKPSGYDIYCKQCKQNRRKREPEKRKSQMDNWLKNGGIEHKKKYRSKIKEDNINSIFLLHGNVCDKCGKIATVETWCQFDLHHIDATTKQFEWGRIINFPWDERHDLELRKCWILCKCCHAQLHYDEYINSNIKKDDNECE